MHYLYFIETAVSEMAISGVLIKSQGYDVDEEKGSMVTEQMEYGDSTSNK